MTRRGRAPAVALALLAAGCAANRPSEVGRALPSGPVVLVKQCSIPSWEPWYARFAVHTWIDHRGQDGRWRRLGVPTPRSDVRRSLLDGEEGLADVRWGEAVRVVDVLVGDRAARVIDGLGGAEEVWREGSYSAFPGPNSNTFVEALARATPGLSPPLEPNALGRDFAPFRAGWTAHGTGVELETPFLGAEVGLREGVQIHLLQLPIGVRFWPPAVVLPFLPPLGPRPALRPRGIG